MTDILTKLQQGREYRNLASIECRAAEDAEEMVVEGYATTFNTEYTLYSDEDIVIREKVDPAAFEGCDMEDVIMQYDHQGRVFARISNGTLAVEPDEQGLKIRANLSGTELGRQLYNEIRGGYTTKMSFGFIVSDDDVEEQKSDGKKSIFVRTIKSIKKLFDVSAVSIPANDATEISARSLCDGVIAKAAEECRKAAEIEERKAKIRILCEL